MTEKHCCSKEDRKKLDQLLGEALFSARVMANVMGAAERALGKELTIQEIAYAISRSTEDCPTLTAALLVLTDVE